MIDLGNNSLLVESPADLPDLTRGKELFLDVETTSHGPDGNALYSFGKAEICGVAATIDDDPRKFYIPVRHRKRNIPIEPYQRWLADHLKKVPDWINHNIKFDALFCAKDGAHFGGRIIDTLTLAKIYHSDRMGYGLKALARDWLGIPPDDEARVKSYLDGIGSKDYGDVPVDILGEYACNDVHINRLLYRMLVEERPTEQEQLWETEIALTAVLFDAEYDGLRIDPTQVKVELVKNLKRQIAAAEELAELGGREFTNSNACVYDILVNQYSLPVLKRKVEEDDTSNPSFDKKALALYRVHPTVREDVDLSRLIDLIAEYRDASYLAGHLKGWLELVDDNNRIHPSYNQTVRTGRMSCSNPNIQGIDKRERGLILPDEGCGIISCDYSQIEFRLIVHYINDLAAIRAYNEDPNTDFHQWVADMVHVKRRAAKPLNFGMGYGAGKRRVLKELSIEPDIVDEVGDIVNEMVARGEIKEQDRSDAFRQLCTQRANEAYTRYHETLPGIKRTAQEAQSACKRRGYVFNAYGRRRHLPPKVARKAFNAIIQGCAMDIMKERMVALSPRYNRKSRDLGIKIKLNVHDEVGFGAPVPTVHDPEVHRWLLDTLQSPHVKFRVPITCGLGVSEDCWAEASGEDNKRQIESGAWVGELV